MTEPTKKLDILYAEIELQIEEQALRKFSNAEVVGFQNKAKALFPLLEKGDTIEVEFKADGKKVNGVVREVGEKSVTINNLPIRIDELTDVSQAYFNVANASQKRDTYVRARTAELEEQRRQYRESLRESQRAAVLNKSGYIQIKGEWVSRYEYLNNEVVARRKVLYTKLQKLAMFKVYFANGLVFFREQWMTAEEAAEIKRLLEEAAKAQAAAAAPAEDPFAADKAAAAAAAAAEGDKKPEPAKKPKKEGEIWD